MGYDKDGIDYYEDRDRDSDRDRDRDRGASLKQDEKEFQSSSGIGDSGISFQSGVPQNKVAMVSQATLANQEKTQQSSGDALKSILSSAAEIQAQAGISKK